MKAIQQFKLIVLLFICTSTTLMYGQQTYLDTFSSVSYANNDGNNNFSSNWSETNDDNNANSGRIRITGNELRFEDISRNSHRIVRTAKLDGATTAILSFNWRTSGLDGSGTVNSEQLNLQLSSDGINFTTIGIFTGTQTGTFNQDISTYISANTTIRFVNVSTWGSGNWEGGEFAYIDDVQITAAYYCPGALNYEFYDGLPTGSTVDNIPTTGALSIGEVSDFDIDALQNTVDQYDTDSYAIRYTGNIEINTAGTYTFFTNSDDGSKLFIDGVQVVNNDGSHGAIEQSGTISLTTGMHTITVLYFEDWGGQILEVRYQGPSIPKQLIPFSILYSSCSPPLIDVTDTDGDGVYDSSDLDDDDDGIVDLDECGNDPRGDVLNATNIQYFSDVTNAEGIPGTSFSKNPTNYPGGSSLLLLQFPVALPIGTTVTVFLEADPIVGTTNMQIQRSNAAGANNGFLADANSIPSGSITTRTFLVSGSTLEYIRIEAYSQGARVYGASYGGGSTCYGLDTDGDGIFNHLDLDSDGDGIPDNVEAQSTLGYTAPANNDSDNDGLDNAYENSGISPQDSDSDGIPDFMDTNSDDHGADDTAEAGITLSNSDMDNDGLDDAIDTSTGYADPGGTIDNPLNTNGGSILLLDSDNDATTTGDVDYRDPAVPTIIVNDVSVDEAAGTAIFTVTHVDLDTSGPFTVNYTTTDATAIAGNDYTTNSGTLNFNGTAGDTEQIVVIINDDSLYESTETFTIQFTSVSDGTVNISSTGTGTITDNEVIQSNVPLTLFEELDGYMDYTSTAGTFRTQPNTGNSCAITTTSSNTLTSPIPAGATIEKAILYWAHSGAAIDPQVTFEGTTIDADIIYRTTLTTRTFHGYYSDVTSLITSIPNPSTNVFDMTNLNIDTSSVYCNSTTVLGGWSLMVFYTDTSLPASTINLYQGFDGNSNSSSTFTLSGFYAIGSTGSKTTALSWEGDQTLANNESLQFTTPSSGTNNLAGDGDNDGITVNNPFNSTNFDNTALPPVNNTVSYGVDLDTYDVSTFILPGETSATTQVNVGQDFVIMNAVILKVPSNLITGRIFEDVAYGGGSGRNFVSSSGIGLADAIVELYDISGTLVDTQTTNANGVFAFAGMINGTYNVRVVNGSVRSSRGGGTTCSSCIPVQTFKTEYIASALVENNTEVGGANPAASDTAAGVFTGAQTLATVTIVNEGVAGLDFGFNFNTIVNTNEGGQGSLGQFIVNSNNLDEVGLDIVTNSIFDPAAEEDTSIFMIPPTGDPLGRTADANFVSGYFDILITSGNQLPIITGTNTNIDGRTQTAYSGDTNSGTFGSGGSLVGTSANALPNYDLPEIQIHGANGDVLRVQGDNTVIRNNSIYADINAGIQVLGGSSTISNNLIGVNAIGVNAGNIDFGIEITGESSLIDGNYISGNNTAGILINGGTSTVIQNNDITSNGIAECDDNITILSGTGIIIDHNLIDSAASLGIDGDGIAGNLTILENTITNSGQNGGNCSGVIQNAGIRLDGSNSSITNNIIASNGGVGLVLAGGNTSGNLISQNSFYANGTTSPSLGIDIDPSDGLGDGVTLNDTSDSDSGPNGAINFPIILEANVSGSNMIIEGYSRPGAILEFFLTDINEGTAILGDNQLGMSTDYGEGQTYLSTVIEGSGSDLDLGSSLYTDLDGNTDNTNKFKFSIPMPSGVMIGNHITATATVANSTSEFSPLSILKLYTVITNRRITYRVDKN